MLFTCVISLVIAAIQAAKAGTCQPMDFQWVRQVRGLQPLCATSDPSGNAYIGGILVAPSAMFDSIQLEKSGSYDAVVAKYDGSGNALWAFQAKGNSGTDAAIQGLAIDALGNLFAVGSFTGTLDLGPTQMSSESSDGFLMKMAPDGQVIWARLITGPDTTYASQVAVDAANNCYVSGLFYQSCAFGGTNLVSAGAADTYLAKFSPSGDLLWGRQVASASYETPSALVVTPSGNAYLAGEFRDSTSFGSINFSGSYSLNCFIAKYGPTGDVEWVQSAGGQANSQIRSASLDPSGNLYVGGFFESNIVFAGSSLIPARGRQDFFAAKLSSQGNLQWIRTGGAYTGYTGVALNSISVSPSGKVYIGADYYGTNDFGCGRVSSRNDRDALIIAYSTEGNFFSSQQWGGDSFDHVQSVAPYGPFNSYVVGMSSFSSTFGSTNLTGNGAYLAKAVPVGAPAVFLNGSRVFSGKAYARGFGTLSLTTSFTGGTILYTLDGSDPTVSGRFYTGPFQVKQSALLRVVAYNGDFTQFVHADPVEVVILPTMTASTDGGGTVAIDPPSGAYSSNGTATLTATPLPGWTFLQWLGDATGTNPVVSVEMSKKRCVQAVFGTTLSTAVVGSGTVAVSPTPTFYPYGSNVRLTALPASGAYLALWGNAASGTNNPLTFSVTNANPTLTAVFASLAGGSLRSLAVQPTGAGSVQRSPYANTYTNGARVTLTAVPEPGQQFLGWTGAASGTSNPLVVTLDSSKVVGATFTDGPRLVLPPCANDVNPFRGWLVGGVGGSFLVESTTNLPATATDWQPVATLTNNLGTIQFEDATTTNSPRRFYRGSIKP